MTREARLPRVNTPPPRPRLGDRLSLRFDGPDGDAEVLGILVGVDADMVTVLPEGKPAVRVPRRAIRAARVVPPRPVRPVSPIEDVATIAAAGWPGAVTERLGGWLLRAASGGSGRANSVLPTGEAGLPIEAAVEAVQAWYGERSLPARFTELTRLPGLTPRFRRDPLDLRAELDRRGWDRIDTTLVLVGDLRRMPLAQDVAATAGRANASCGVASRDDAGRSLGGRPRRRMEGGGRRGRGPLAGDDAEGGAVPHAHTRRCPGDVRSDPHDRN